MAWVTSVRQIWRAGSRPGRIPLARREKKCDSVDAQVRNNGYVNGVFGNGLPLAQRAEQCDRQNGSRNTTGDGDKDRLGEQLAQDVAACGSDGEPDGEFAGAVRGARGADAGEVDACGHEHQQRQNHHRDEEGSRRCRQRHRP